MSILNRIGKDKVINRHHQAVPYRIPEPQYTVFGLLRSARNDGIRALSTVRALRTTPCELQHCILNRILIQC
jgi:hypothetical protein